MKKPDDVKIIFPVDVSTLRQAYSLLEEVGEHVDVVKVGLQFITRVTQPVALNVAKEFGKDGFFDGKFIDIPNTVYETSRAVVQYVPMGLKYFNVMALGLEKMMAEAVRGAHDGAKEFGVDPPKIIAVHYLTSTDIPKLKEAGIQPPPGMTFDSDSEKMRWFTAKLARMSVNAGVDILLSSAQEAPMLNKKFPEKEIWSPGIRLPKDPPDDQKRTMTPGEAYLNGVRGLIIGRPIREPKGGRTRQEVIDAIYADIDNAKK